MNPPMNEKYITKLMEQDLQGGRKTSRPDQYNNGAWIFIGNCPYDLAEEDIMAVFSQFGKVVNMDLVRDKNTGKSKGHGLLCYEDEHSTTLAVDNLNKTKIWGRTIRVEKARRRPLKNES